MHSRLPRVLVFEHFIFAGRCVMRATSSGIRLLSAIVAIAGIGAEILWINSSGAAAWTSGSGAAPGPVAELVGVKLKFDGAATCSDSGCHGAPARQLHGESYMNEYTLWHNRKEPHHNATTNLATVKGKAIAKALGIANPLKDSRCSSCHTLTVPDDLQGLKFTIREGVTCTACHGPSEKWLPEHSTLGWLDSQRKAFPDHQALLQHWGLFDTKPLVARSSRCTSCHLQIDPELVAKGHPQPTFEIVAFTENYAFRHWEDKKGFELARLWAAGQIAALPEALDQLADRATNPATQPAQLKEAYDEAMAHWFVMKPLIASGALKGDPATMNASADKLTAAMKSGDKHSLASVAGTMSSSIKSLGDAIPGYAPDKQSTAALLKSLASNSASGYGDPGIEQQGDALLALSEAVATSSDASADAKSVQQQIASTIAPWKKKVSAAGFDSALKSLASQLK
jgi:hypothetical protein